MGVLVEASKEVSYEKEQKGEFPQTLHDAIKYFANEEKAFNFVEANPLAGRRCEVPYLRLYAIDV